ncbi:FHA domain-containing protein, partial [Streptomyces antibioticus]|uniref:FHA domain-containing protein n=1 Tax=Streptomyces antibioticus TaxID=1890 RepID=UPI003F467A1A
MQIRLTVTDPQGPPFEARGRAASCDVLVTAPAGTALAAVAPALAAAVSGEGAGGAAVVLYAGTERLDGRRCTLGEPPLTDGAVLALGAPADPEPHPEVDDAPARLDVVAGPDAGGVHLLHGGQIRVGRSADADVPLDDPDVSRLHCAVTLGPDGRVTVTDLGSTNGTTVDGTPVKTRPVRLAPGALLRIGESALRLAPPGGPGARVVTAPDGEGHVRVPCGGGRAVEGATGSAATAVSRPRVPNSRSGEPGTPTAPTGPTGPTAPTGHSHGAMSWSDGTDRHLVPGQGTAPDIESRHDTHAGRADAFGPPYDDVRGPRPAVSPYDDVPLYDNPGYDNPGDPDAPGSGRKGTPLRGTDIPPGVRRRGGLSAWARRLAGGRGAPDPAGHGPADG